MTSRLFQSPWCPDHRSPLNLDKAIVPAHVDDLAVETCWAEDALDNFPVKIKSIRGNQRNKFEIHPAGYVSKEGKCVSVTSPPNDCRRPKPRPDLDRGEDPDRLFLAEDDRANLVCLKLGNGDAGIVKLSDFELL